MHQEVNPWALAYLIFIWSAIYIVSINGVGMALHQRKFGLAWGLLFMVGIFCALVYTYILAATFFNF